jgi:hypothetical protein
MSNDLIAGFADLLTAGGVTVDDGETPNLAVLPRTVLYADPGASERETLCGRPDGLVVTIQTTCIGETREQAGAEADRVRELVEGERVTAPGWVCNTVKNLFTNLPRRDDDVQPAVFYAVVTWRFTAVPS